jgi:hypothetical protein
MQLCYHQTLDLGHGLAFGNLLITLPSIVFRYFPTTATIILSIWTMVLFVTPILLLCYHQTLHLDHGLPFTPFDYFATTKLSMLIIALSFSTFDFFVITKLSIWTTVLSFATF